MQTELEQDPEAQEWNDAIASVIAYEGSGRASDLLDSVVATARRSGAQLPFAANTAYINTIPPRSSRRIPATASSKAAFARRSAGMRPSIVLKANKESSELGGHIASLPVGGDALRHRLHALLARAHRSATAATSSIVQGHSSPGIYARAFLEGRLTEEQLLQLPPGSRRQGALVLSASLADAGLLAVPDRVDGAWAAHGDLPGALPEIPPLPRPRRYEKPATSGCSAATARWTSRRASARSRSPGARSSTT